MADLIAVAAGPDRRKGSAVFFHGLTGHPYETWGAERAAPGSGGDIVSRERFWLDWLAADPLLDGLSIHTVAYEADAWESRTLGAMSLFSHGENVLAMLASEPSLVEGPVALVGHSLGGIIIKQVLREAWDRRNHDPFARRLIDRLARVVFIATPHQGSWLPVLVERWGWFAWRPTIVTRSLKEGDEALLKLKRWYTNFCGIEKPGLRHLVFRETHRTNRLMVVTEASADPGVPAEQVPVAANHLDIARPPARTAEVYRRTRDFLAGMIAPSSPAEASGFRLAGQRILHREVREVAGLTPRPEMDAALDAAFGKAPARPIVLSNSGQVTRTVAGMAGVGKTELARAFAWRHRDSYSAVWWIAAETREGIVQGLAELGERLAPETADVSRGERAAEETIARIEASFEERPVLIVYDNLPSPADLDDLVPRTNSHVLVTSRWSDWFGTAEQVDVGLFSEAQAVEHLTQAAADRDEEGALRLARELGCLPLAIDHAASYRRSRRARSFDDYRQRLADLIHARPGPRARANLYPASVHRTFTLALDRVIAEHPGAEAVMALAAFTSPEAVPVTLACAGDAAPAQHEAALAALAEVSLVGLATSGSGEPVFRLHRLVQLVMQDRLDSAGRLGAALQGAVEAVDRLFPRTAYEFALWPGTRPLVPHARAVLAHAREHGLVAEAVGRLAVKLAQHLNATGHFAGAEDLFRLGIAVYEQVQGPEANAVGVALTSLALLHENQGRYDDAVPLLERDLAITAATLGTDDPQYAATLDTLAVVRMAQGRAGEAEPLLQQALDIRESRLGPDHADTVAILGELASCYVAQSRYGDAEPLLVRALTVTAKDAGPDHPDTAAALSRLAELYVTLGRHAEAEPLLERDVAISETALGPDNHETAAALANLAHLRVMQARYGEAEPLLERALAIREAAFGTAHPMTAASLHGLGWLRTAQGRYREATELYGHALSIRELLLGSEHAATGATLNALGLLGYYQGRYDEAEALLDRDLAISRAALGKGHPDTAATLTSLGQLMLATGRLAAAEPLLAKALEVRERVLGGDHPSTASTLAGMGWLRILGDRLREAGPLLDRALDIRMRRLGPGHPWVARTLVGMAEVAFREGQHARAGQLAQRSLDIRRAVLPPAHPDIAQSLLALARVRAARGERFAVRMLLQEAVRLLEPEVEAGQSWLVAARELLDEAG